jgi:hypothetical protein
MTTLLFAALVVLPVDRPTEVSDQAITLFTERLLVELDAVGVEAESGARGDRTLKVRLVAEEEALTAFVALAEGTKTLRRGEWRKLGEADLARRLPARVAAWVADLPAEDTSPTLAVVTTAETRSLATRVAGKLAGWDGLTVGLDQPARSPFRADVKIDAVEVVKRRHHVNDYLDGSMKATLVISATDGGRVLFSKQATVTYSRKARKTTRQEIVTALEALVVDDWMASFRARMSPADFERSDDR